METTTDLGRVRILGIDPGSIRTGYGILDEHQGRLSLLAAGAISPPAADALPAKLAYLFGSVESLISEFKPTEVAVEGLFHAKHARSALILGHARGVILLAAARAHLPVFEYAPREVKKALVGTGSAEKEQVRTMVRLLLRLKQDIHPLDASDGVAISICHAHSRRLKLIERRISRAAASL